MPEPLIRRPGDLAPIQNPVGGEITFALRGEETAGHLTVLETIAAPGEGPPLHTHADEDECLVVLDGTVRFRLRDDVEIAPPGSLAFVPRGVPHTWENVGDAPARMLVLFTPAGMERFFDRFADLDGPGPEAFLQAAAGTGMTVVGPPLGATHPR
jgi:quercetin dioxygenase-like cupin family protein